MAAVQLKFSLRTSSNVKTVHLVGSWDNYARQLPLSADEKPGSWVGKFRFQTSMLQLGGRYWYYYIMDGYHVSHDPAVEYTVEPTTGRKLNILDVPGGKPTRSAPSSRRSAAPAQGRGLSPSRIQHPKPSKPYASRSLREAEYSAPTVDDITRRFAGSRLSDDYSYSSSPPSSSGSSLSSRSSRSGNSSPSSLSSLSDTQSHCSCERYGITRKGDRVKLDCGGGRCGYAEESTDDSCSDSEDDEEYVRARSAARRQGIVVRR